MKKVILIFAIVITGFIAFFISCDKIDKPYRNVEEVPECDTPSFPALTANNIIQKILLEDYTGHKCNNCPEAQTEANRLKTKMGDTLVLMAVHVGSLAAPEAAGDCAFSTDFRTEAGNAYLGEFRTTQLPTGLINRRMYGTRYTSGYADWKNILDTTSRRTPSIGIQIIPANNNIAADEMCIFVKTSLFSNVSNNLRLCVLLTENKIISPQQYPTTVDCNYEHNHVLRGAISSAWGNDLTISQNGDSQIRGYSLSFSGKVWKKENCDIIAFVYDKDSYEILQVEEIKLVE
jgi:hypothetical protein